MKYDVIIYTVGDQCWRDTRFYICISDFSGSFALEPEMAEKDSEWESVALITPHSFLWLDMKMVKFL